MLKKKSKCRTCDRKVSKIRHDGRRIFGQNVVVLHLRSYWHFFVQKERRLGQIEASTPSTIMSAFSAQFKGKDKQKNASNVSKRTNSNVITTISLDTSRDIAKKNNMTWHMVKWNQDMQMLPKEVNKKKWVIFHLSHYIINKPSL